MLDTYAVLSRQSLSGSVFVDDECVSLLSMVIYALWSVMLLCPLSLVLDSSVFVVSLLSLLVVLLS